MNRDNFAAIDGAVAHNPRHIAPLIAKADYMAEAGDLRAASAPYLQRSSSSTLFEAVDARGGTRVAWGV